MLPDRFGGSSYRQNRLRIANNGDRHVAVWYAFDNFFPGVAADRHVKEQRQKLSQVATLRHSAHVAAYADNALDSIPTALSVTCVPTYEFGDGTVVSFRKVRVVPGMSHRVSINGLAVDYLQEDQRPSAASARFFYDKHVAAR